MFRKTLITTTIAAAAFLALGSPAPASAISWAAPSIDLPDATLPDFDLPESIVPGPTDEPPADEPTAPVDETTTTTAVPHEDAPVVESASFNTEEAHVTPTTTVATGEVTDETPNVQVTEAITASGTDQRGSFDPMMAALFGALGSLAIVLLTLSAFVAGRRRN